MVGRGKELPPLPCARASGQLSPGRSLARKQNSFARARWPSPFRAKARARAQSGPSSHRRAPPKSRRGGGHHRARRGHRPSLVLVVALSVGLFFVGQDAHGTPRLPPSGRQRGTRATGPRARWPRLIGAATRGRRGRPAATPRARKESKGESQAPPSLSNPPQKIGLSDTPRPLGARAPDARESRDGGAGVG